MQKTVSDEARKDKCGARCIDKVQRNDLTICGQSAECCSSRGLSK